MNCLSRRARLRAAISVGAAALLVLGASGAYAGGERSAANVDPAPSGGPAVETTTSDGGGAAIATSDGGDAAIATSGGEPSIVFTGSAMAPLVCTSTPDVPAVTITEDTRITLANFTGAEASIDTGTVQELTVPDGAGLSVRFRPGQYAVRMVPACTLTSGIGAATVTVMDLAMVEPRPTSTRSVPAATGPPGPGSTSPVRTRPTLPEATTAAPTGDARAGVPLVGATPSGATSTGTTPIEATPIEATRTDGPPSSGPAIVVESGSGDGAAADGERAAGAGSASASVPTRSAVLPPIAQGAGPVIYDPLRVQVQPPGDPRDARLLAVIAIVCVFGVTAAIIRAILSQHARHTLST